MKRGALTLGGVAVLLLAAGALFASKSVEHDAARHSLEVAERALPVLALDAEDAAGLTRIELMDPEAEPPARLITLEKRADSWQLTMPLDTRASVPKVQALIENLSALRVTDEIDPGSSLYEPYGLSDAKAFHVRAYRGARKLRDLYFGKSSARGQLLRLAGKPGVFSIDGSGAGSYAGYLYTRPLRSWRESQLLAFDEQQVSRVQIENGHGQFVFDREGDAWSGAQRSRNAGGRLAPLTTNWSRFDASKVWDLLRAFRQLSADEFGEERDRAKSGLDRAELSGGVITIVMRDSSSSSIRIGNEASGPSSWAIHHSRWASKSGPDTTLYALALWTTDWVTSGAQRFER